jgi:hypothetical protein
VQSATKRLLQCSTTEAEDRDLISSVAYGSMFCPCAREPVIRCGCRVGADLNERLSCLPLCIVQS